MHDDRPAALPLVRGGRALLCDPDRALPDRPRRPRPRADILRAVRPVSHLVRRDRRRRRRGGRLERRGHGPAGELCGRGRGQRRRRWRRPLGYGRRYRPGEGECGGGGGDGRAAWAMHDLPDAVLLHLRAASDQVLLRALLALWHLLHAPARKLRSRQLGGRHPHHQQPLRGDQPPRLGEGDGAGRSRPRLHRAGPLAHRSLCQHRRAPLVLPLPRLHPIRLVGGRLLAIRPRCTLQLIAAHVAARGGTVAHPLAHALLRSRRYVSTSHSSPRSPLSHLPSRCPLPHLPSR